MPHKCAMKPARPLKKRAFFRNRKHEPYHRAPAAPISGFDMALWMDFIIRTWSGGGNRPRM
jgi:hypothetical protein